MKLNRTLIDADSIYFRAVLKCDEKYDIRKAIRKSLDIIRRDTLCNDPLIAVKGKGNFRKDLYPDYKAKRPTLEDDVRERLAYGHNYLVEEHGAVMADGMEADDLVAIWAYEAMAEGEHHVIAGIDKDLLQIPGEHYNFGKGTTTHVDVDTAHYNLMVQCLTGDNTDNIPGIKGIGPKKAEKILNGIPGKRRWNRIRAAWKHHNAGDPKLSYDLLRMITSWEELDDMQKRIRDSS